MNVPVHQVESVVRDVLQKLTTSAPAAVAEPVAIVIPALDAFDMAPAEARFGVKCVVTKATHSPNAVAHGLGFWCRVARADGQPIISARLGKNGQPIKGTEQAFAGIRLHPRAAGSSPTAPTTSPTAATSTADAWERLTLGQKTRAAIRVNAASSANYTEQVLCSNLAAESDFNLESKIAPLLAARPFPANCDGAAKIRHLRTIAPSLLGSSAPGAAVKPTAALGNARIPTLIAECDFAAAWNESPDLQREFTSGDRYGAYMRYNAEFLQMKRRGDISAHVAWVSNNLEKCGFSKSARPGNPKVTALIAGCAFETAWAESPKLQAEFTSAGSYAAFMRNQPEFIRMKREGDLAAHTAWCEQNLEQCGFGSWRMKQKP